MLCHFQTQSEVNGVSYDERNIMQNTRFNRLYMILSGVISKTKLSSLFIVAAAKI